MAGNNSVLNLMPENFGQSIKPILIEWKRDSTLGFRIGSIDAPLVFTYDNAEIPMQFKQLSNFGDIEISGTFLFHDAALSVDNISIGRFQEIFNNRR